MSVRLPERRPAQKVVQLSALVRALPVLANLPADGEEVGGDEEGPVGDQDAGGEPDQHGDHDDDDGGGEAGKEGVPDLPPVGDLVFVGGSGDPVGDGVEDGSSYD